MPATTNLYVRNADILEYFGKEKTRLTAAAAASDTTITVRDNVGFANNEYIGIGEPGSPRSEIIKIGGSVTAGTSITVGSLVFSHPIDTPIYRLPGNQLRYFRASTLSGSKSTLATIDIDYNLEETRYGDTSNSSGFFWIKIYDSNTAAEISDYIGGWNYIQFNIDSFGAAQYLALKREGEEYSRLITEEWMDREVDAFRSHIKERMNVELEIGQDTSLSLVTNQRRYAMPSGIKSPNGIKGIINLRLGLYGSLKFLTWREYLNKFDGTAHTTVGTAASVGDTSITLNNTYEFSDPSSGTASILIAGQTITYTTNTESTGVLSGIPSSGTGSITAAISVGVDVWQGVSEGLPTHFCPWDGYIYTYPIASSDYAGVTMTIDHWEDDSTSLVKTESLDVISEICAIWLQWRIEKVNKNSDWRDMRGEFYKTRDEFFGLSDPNLKTSFDVDVDDEQSYEA